jgi:hypothetical protein
MTEPRPTLLTPSTDLTITIVDDHACPPSPTAEGFVGAAAARLGADDWRDETFGRVAGVRCARHRVDPRVVLVEIVGGMFASPRPVPPDALAGFAPGPDEVVLDGARRDAVLVEIGGDLFEIVNDEGRVTAFHATAATSPELDAPAPELSAPPEPATLYADLEIDAAIADRARALASDPVGALEAHGLVLRTWSHPDPVAALDALLAGRDVPEPFARLDAWLASLDEGAVQAWSHRAHARLDAWAEAVLDLDEREADEVDPDLGALLLAERDALESLRVVLARRGERALGARLDSLDPLLRDGPPIAWDPAPEDRAWIARVHAADADAWWTAPLFLAPS